MPDFLAPILEQNGVKTALPRFRIKEFNRNFNQNVTGTFHGRQFFTSGDGLATPGKIKLEGNLSGSTSEEFYERKDRIYRLLSRGAQWLILGDRRIAIAGLTSDKNRFDDFIANKSHTFELEVNLLRGYWESNDIIRVTDQFPAGAILTALTLNAENLGTLPAYPEFSFLVRNVNKIQIDLWQKSMIWTNTDSSNTSSLFTGEVGFFYTTGRTFKRIFYDATGLYGTILSTRTQISPGSQFNHLRVGNNPINIFAWGSNPLVNINFVAYRHAYH